MYGIYPVYNYFVKMTYNVKVFILSDMKNGNPTWQASSLDILNKAKHFIK